MPTIEEIKSKTIELLNTIEDEEVKQKALKAFNEHPFPDSMLTKLPENISEAIDNFKFDATEEGQEFWEDFVYSIC